MLDKVELKMRVAYQQSYMKYPDYGIVVGITKEWVYVLFDGEISAKACHITDLFIMEKVNV